MNCCKLSKILCGLITTVICLVISIGLFSVLHAFKDAKPNTPCADSFGTITYLHRGNLSFAQENTFDSVVTGSAALGSDVELDVTVTKGGDMVLFHDTSLKRMTGVDKDLKDASTEELLNLTISATIDGYNYNTTNSITELQPVVKAICEETEAAINFDVKTPEVVDDLVSIIKDSGCIDRDGVIMTSGYPNIIKDARKKFDDAGLENIRIGMFMPKPNEKKYYGLGQKFALKTRLLHTLLSGTGSSIIEFHKSTFDNEKDAIKEWQDDGWCIGIYGIRPEEVDNYPNLNVYIVDEGPVFPDMEPYGGYGQDEPAKEIIYKNGTDDSLKWYYGLNAIAAVLLVIALLSIYLTFRACKSEGNKEKEEDDDEDYAKADEVKNDTNDDPEFGVVVH